MASGAHWLLTTRQAAGARCEQPARPDYARAPDSQASVGELFSEVAEDLSTLLRQEVELAKAELRQSATRAGKGAGLLAGAGVSGHMVLLFASVAAWWGIGDATGHGWSALIVGGHLAGDRSDPRADGAPGDQRSSGHPADHARQ